MNIYQASVKYGVCGVSKIRVIVVAKNIEQAKVSIVEYVNENYYRTNDISIIESIEKIDLTKEGVVEI